MFETLPNPMNKIKILPLAIALALSGCGSDETTPIDTAATWHPLIGRSNHLLPDDRPFYDATALL
ncbi:hypothetical protein A79_4727 [Vibrio parahaemolyticus AQ3810]|nr:hypothetical protein A79_4727 [Vibrio parahaemolyticus AQ3810]